MNTIDVATLQRWLDEGRPVLVLDVRASADRAEWAIPLSQHADVYTALKAGDPAALAGLDLPRDTPIVTVCGMRENSHPAVLQPPVRPGSEASAPCSLLAGVGGSYCVRIRGRGVLCDAP